MIIGQMLTSVKGCQLLKRVTVALDELRMAAFAFWALALTDFAGEGSVIRKLRDASLSDCFPGPLGRPPLCTVGVGVGVKSSKPSIMSLLNFLFARPMENFVWGCS